MFDMYDANLVYECAGNTQINWYLISHNEFTKYCISLNLFKKQIYLDANADDEYLADIIRELNVYRYNIYSLPIPFNDTNVISEEKIRFLSKKLKKCKLLFPNYEEIAVNLFERLKYLSNCNENPILDFMNENYKGIKLNNTAILLKEPNKFNRFILKNSQFNSVRILGSSDLKGVNCYDRIIVIGPINWFPEYVFNASRAKEIDIITFSCVKCYIKDEPSFIGYTPTNPIKINKREILLDNAIKDEDMIEPEEILLEPKMNWFDISNENISNEVQVNGMDRIEAIQVLLEGNYAVFLDSSESAKSLIIDFKDNTNKSKTSIDIVKLTNKSIEPGTFILLRTSGGGDYVIEIADRFMGENASKFRRIQSQWKMEFLNIIENKGVQEISKTLRALGSSIATEINVRNWASEKNISPRNFKDFLAIMKLIGKSEESAKKIWENCKRIEQSHRHAGHYIRKLLIRKVYNTNLSELKSLGRMDFELDEVDGGKMSAFRVIDIAPNQYTVPLSRVGVVYYAGGEMEYG
ncbi:hypothetical protein [Desulforamulus ferrireducens]|uniref:DISARM protein DrmE C-terminal domain-containing protein n=1 Tax=Desulforamulus ferrireducens TaxID=1833852 RepID=A0A1S6IXM5_9FIRM|nr:hypothetical protein [Desulforamulus ferrireducens]AQS59527.1 hypothetical protein B0537_10810 [Desulforamulus ferrireducens]